MLLMVGYICGIMEKCLPKVSEKAIIIDKYGTISKFRLQSRSYYADQTINWLLRNMCLFASPK